MTDDRPIACSLDPSELPERLATIAEIGADSLVSREVRGGRHLLRFRADAATRERLEGVVDAEAACCSFLDLALAEDADELLLSIAAPAEGRAVADGLARAFEGAGR